MKICLEFTVTFRAITVYVVNNHLIARTICVFYSTDSQEKKIKAEKSCDLLYSAIPELNANPIENAEKGLTHHEFRFFFSNFFILLCLTEPNLVEVNRIETNS